MFAMVERKLMTARKLLREGGMKRIREHSWHQLQFFAITRGLQHKVRLDKCKFNIDGIHQGQQFDLATNQYELSERIMISRHLQRDLPVIELGGSMGVVACITNKLLKYPTAHVVVEANPFAIPHLEQNKQLNGCQFEIVNNAIAYGTDSVCFRPSSNLCANSILEPGDQAPITVPTIKLAKLVQDRAFDKFALVCDIEGLEYDLVCNEINVIEKAYLIILETHERFIGAKKVHSMIKALEGVGFELIDSCGYVVVLQR
jgi:FkbM family methyltransferase